MQNIIKENEALRDQREWLRVTLSCIGDGVITTDNKGDVTFLNPVAQCGLALVQRLTELHGGKVEVHSSLGHGSEFVVRLPLILDELEESDLPTVDNDSLAARPLRVLVVDDNVDTVHSFSMLLKASGHEVCSASDGIEAVKAAYDFRPDVMLLDIGLPGLNGYEVAKRIRQQPIFKNLVLVALTGYGQDADRQISKQAGFDHHLVKPARIEQLQEILANASAMALASVI